MLKHQELIEGKKVVFRLTTDKIKTSKLLRTKETTLNNLSVEGIDCVLDKYRSLLQ